MKLYRVPSESTPGVAYDVTCTDTNTTCTCPGFQHRQECKHATARMKMESNVQWRPLPMLAKPWESKYAKYFGNRSQARYRVEEKLDGHRIMIRVTNSGRIEAWSRTGIDCTKKLHQGLLSELFHLPSGIYDGELVAPSRKSYHVTDYQYRNKLVLYIFDAVELVGSDTTWMDYGSRRSHLLAVFEKLEADAGVFTYVKLINSIPVASEAELKLMVEGIWEQSGEGVIVKDTQAPYLPGKRNAAFLKIKDCKSDVFIILGFAPSSGEKVDRGPFGVTIVQHPDSKIITMVKTLDDETLQRADLLATEDTFKHPVTIRASTGMRLNALTIHPWVGRKLRIEYHEQTEDNYRHARWDRFEDE